MGNATLPVHFIDPAELLKLEAAIAPWERGVLNTVNQKIAAAESLDQVMAFLFDTTKDIFPCDRIGLAFLEENGRRIVSRWVKAKYEPVVLPIGYTEDTSGSSLKEILKTGALRIIDDLEQHLKNRPESPSTRLLIREGVRSNMTCPLKVEGRPVGFLFRSSRTAGAYDKHQAMLHVLVAERLGQAVEKASRIGQLEAANQAYREMLGFVSHELKSPLASIALEGHTLADGYFGDLNDRQKEKIGNIIARTDFLLGLTRDYLDLARIEGGPPHAEMKRVDSFSKAIVEPVINILKPQAESRPCRIEFIHTGPEDAVCDPDLTKIALVNLVGNAIKYGKDGGLVRVRTERSPDRLTISVWNDGPGFSPAEKGKLFRKFSRLPSSAAIKQKGSGLGLYNVWQIVQMHGGRVRAESEPGQWAEFVMEIPQTEPL